jgi:uncharacterized protein YjiK
MRRLLLIPAVVAAVLMPISCAGNADAGENSEVLKEREARYVAAIASADSGGDDKPIARWVMPEALREISGLTLTQDGRLFAHGDEHAEISEIDYKRGVIVKRFLLGDQILRDDFEGIAAVGDRFFMMTSVGRLYEFKEGADKASVPYVMHDAALGKDCELEGVAYDSTSNSLVMPCKVVKDEKLADRLVLFRWSLDSTASPRVTRLDVPLASVVGSPAWDEFHSSDMTVDPKTGNYVIVSAQEKGLIVMTPKGQFVAARELDDMHNQVEGVAITRDGVLIISDEIGKDKPAHVTLYRWR